MAIRFNNLNCMPPRHHRDFARGTGNKKLASKASSLQRGKYRLAQRFLYSGNRSKNSPKRSTTPTLGFTLGVWSLLASSCISNDVTVSRVVEGFEFTSPLATATPINSTAFLRFEARINRFRFLPKSQRLSLFLIVCHRLFQSPFILVRGTSGDATTMLAQRVTLLPYYNTYIRC